jgi:hypothetical protein
MIERRSVDRRGAARFVPRRTTIYCGRRFALPAGFGRRESLAARVPSRSWDR